MRREVTPRERREAGAHLSVPGLSGRGRFVRGLRALAALPLVLLALLAVGCAPRAERTPALPPDDMIKAAQQKLTDTCLTRKGLTPPRPGSRAPSTAEQQRVARALFGTGRTELSLTLPTGHSVRAHTDGCLASAQRTLYGDQRRWFRVSTVVNNLKPEAAFREQPLTEIRARHRTDLADWRRLRTRALINAKAHLQSESSRAVR
ncbi:hypothetical protein [Streptomyces sp. NPDC127108]|uniref:hypothetical protein n=1 Tax=Streptomyces sp. NPDC127108 TaxID=3345361 RepID=UPI0036392FF7